jgi:hypothetical protein
MKGFFGAVLILSLTAGRASASPGQGYEVFFGAVRKLVEKHYPKAEFSVTGSELHFAFNTRKYMIHEARKDGEWQDATEHVGPQKGGICGDAVVAEGRFEGAAVVPQGFDRRYFVDWMAAPYAEKLKRHLLVHLKYPGNVPKEFVDDFVALIATFEKLGP